MPAQYFADPSGQQWNLSVDNNAMLMTSQVSGQIAVPSVVLSDSAGGQLWELSIVGPGPDWGEPRLTAVTSGVSQTQLLVNAPNGTLWSIKVLNGELRTEPGAFGGITVPAGKEPRNPIIMLRWSDDGGHTWSNEHRLDCGSVGQYKRRVIARRLGRARDRVYEIAVSDPVPWRIIEAYLNPRSGK